MHKLRGEGVASLETSGLAPRMGAPSLPCFFLYYITTIQLYPLTFPTQQEESVLA